MASAHVAPTFPAPITVTFILFYLILLIRVIFCGAKLEKNYDSGGDISISFEKNIYD
jgi:hypothetical protein